MQTAKQSASRPIRFRGARKYGPQKFGDRRKEIRDVRSDREEILSGQVGPALKDALERSSFNVFRRFSSYKSDLKLIQACSLSEVTRSASFFLKAIVLGLQKRNASARGISEKRLTRSLASNIHTYIRIAAVYRAKLSRAFESSERRNGGNGIYGRVYI